MAERKPDERLRVLWGIQQFDVRYVHFEDVPGRRGRRKTIRIVGLEDRRGCHNCPDCGRSHHQGVIREEHPRRFRDGSMGDYETFIEIIPWRVACCGGTRVEKFPWQATGHRMTRRFFDRIAGLATRLSIKAVSEMASLSWYTVATIDKEATEMALGPRDALLDGLRWMGVDEVSRTGGHSYFTIVTNLETGRVIWIGNGKGEKVLNEFFDELGKKRCRKVRGVISDLDAGYLAAIGKRIPKAIHVLDRFHIIKWVNEALDAVRRRLFGQAPKDELGRYLKGKRWLMLSAWEKLERQQKDVLSILMKMNRPLFRCYLLKEDLRAILHYPWKYMGVLDNHLNRWCQAAIRSRIEEMKAVGYRIRAHLDKVKAAWKAPIKKGLVEAINGTVALLRHVARGFRNKEYYKFKIFQRCSLATNPWAEIVL